MVTSPRRIRSEQQYAERVLRLLVHFSASVEHRRHNHAVPVLRGGVQRRGTHVSIHTVQKNAFELDNGRALTPRKKNSFELDTGRALTPRK